MDKNAGPADIEALVNSGWRCASQALPFGAGRALSLFDPEINAGALHELVRCWGSRPSVVDYWCHVVKPALRVPQFLCFGEKTPVP